MKYSIIGNIIALIASLLMVYTGFLKNKKKIIFLQTIQILLYTVGNFLLNSIPGAIINILNCIRNILCYENKLGKKEKIIITILSIILTLKFNNLGIIGYLPGIISVSYIWLMTTKDVVKFKTLIIITTVLWFIHDIYIGLYTSAIFDFASIIANFISIYHIKTKKISGGKND